MTWCLALKQKYYCDKLQLPWCLIDSLRMKKPRMVRSAALQLSLSQSDISLGLCRLGTRVELLAALGMGTSDGLLVRQSVHDFSSE